MAELVWNGKDALGLDHQTEPEELLVEEVHGGGAGASPPPSLDPPVWTNRLVRGDVARVLPRLVHELRGQVALVYVDPPFETGSSFSYLASIPEVRSDAPRVKVPAYRDAVGLDAWLASFHATAVALRELLRDGGSLYVHLDEHIVHYAKVLLDEVFGPGSFQREIVWRIGWVSGFKSRAKNWIRNHDVILFYAKGGNRSPGFLFHKEHVPYPLGYVRRDGQPPKGRGYPLEDVWNSSELDRLDSIQIMSFSGEKVGYPTQKNENLVARIVSASSSPGDIVLDCFAGSGTAAAVAEKLGRRWVAIDSSEVAVHAARKRLLRLPHPQPFVVEGLARSERAPPAGKGERRSLEVEASVSGASCTIQLRSFVMPVRSVPREARRRVRHWSQWLDGWCVDWDHRGEALRVGACTWRPRPAKPVALTSSHTYERAGSYRALIKAFDILGGATTAEITVDVRPGRRGRPMSSTL